MSIAAFTVADGQRIARATREWERTAIGGAAVTRQAWQQVTRVYVAGHRWLASAWTGTPSRYLRVPFDGVTAPSYELAAVYDAFDWDTVPADESDDRAIAAHLDLGEIQGPAFYVRIA